MENPYQVHHRELSRIAAYALPKEMVLLFLGLGAAAIVLFGFVAMPLALLAVLFVGYAVFVRLWVKHRLDCPICGVKFYGPFQILKPYTRKCAGCGFDLVPQDPVSLRGNDL